MNKKKLLKSIIIVLIIIILLIIINNSNNKDLIEITEFETDKNNYKSQETIIVTLNVFSPEDIEQTKIKLTGIRPYNYAYIDSSKRINLKKGDNKIVFEEKAPYCTSGCGGVFPGPYDLEAGIFINQTLITSEQKTITLRA